MLIVVGARLFLAKEVHAMVCKFKTQEICENPNIFVFFAY